MPDDLSDSAMKLLAQHNVRRISRVDGDQIDVLGTRQVWKVRGRDVGFAFGIYEMTLEPGEQVPLHAHPYPEYFYVVSGTLDVGRVAKDRRLEWLRCTAGESALAPISAPHTIANRSQAPVTFTSTSTYHHEALFEEVGMPSEPGSSPAAPDPLALERFDEAAARYQGTWIEAVDSGRLVDR